ncbi:hypothetical protein WH95_19595 [Kiloniella litopenaei]|uniref:Conjugal transfer protein TrbC n=1 Tax=Kiloniella litopenaei TaxID=1549748 RepID=A0A0M2R5H3_9PROT|nr:hypothetical protein [Kiloniella litopenaei]KKJ75225.1 hypothetical protein WH95_19595 [Kiloniella litopenaei]
MFNKIKAGVGAAVIGFQAKSAMAAFALGSSGGKGGIAEFEGYIQDWVNFMTGPFGLAVVVVSIIVAVVVFVFAPKQGPMGLVARAVVAGIVILNLTTVVGGFTST